MSYDIKRSISFYNYQDEYYAGILDLEGCLRECAKTGATGVELLAEQMIRKFPKPIEDEAFRENWFAMLAKYGLTPSCYDAFLENRIYRNRMLKIGETYPSVIVQVEKNTFREYREYRVREGTSQNQVKTVRVINSPEVLQLFMDHSKSC